MSIELGEAREKWARDVWNLAENFASNVKDYVKPFYIVFACKQDRHKPNTFRQTIKAYYSKPEGILGILVWYVDREKGIFELSPELSSPPDIPVDPTLLSQKSEDFSQRVASKGKKMNVLLS